MTTKITGLSGTISVTDASQTTRTSGPTSQTSRLQCRAGLQDVTGMNKFAHEQLLLLTDFTLTLNGVFDPGANLSHSVFSTVSGTSVTRSVSVSPTAVTTTPIITVNVLITDYQITRANTAELTWQVPAQLADGAVPTWA